MINIIVASPPTIVPISTPLIFLNGPIQSTGDWQANAVTYISRLAEGPLNIANPRRDYLDNEFDYNAQVDWETEYRRRAGEAGVNLFWLAAQSQNHPGRAYAQTTRAELFESKERHLHSGIKMVIGIESGFSGERYIRRRFGQDCPDVLILDDLEATCRAALNLL